MRIAKLQLMAFGPFTGATLDFSAPPGFHVIYGPNEAGKSSALRAIYDLLYEVPLRSGDNFVHKNPKLRLGATLEMSDGSALSFVRRKASRLTLRDANDEEPLAEDALDRFLGGIDRPTFLTMFGIDHAGLVEGGKEILKGGGAVGKVLFAAGTGLAHLHGIQTKLAADSDALFKSGGQNPRINQAIRQWQATRTEMGQIQLSVDVWNQHETDLRAAEKREREIAAEIGKKRREQKRLERIRNGAPVVARWKRETAELNECRDAPLLPDDFPSRRSQALIALKTAQQQVLEAESELRRIFEQLKGLNVPDDLLEEAAAIEHLRERLGSHRKAMSDRPELERDRLAAEKDAEEILKKMGRPGLTTEIEALRLPADKVVRIQGLSTQYEGLVEKFEAARREQNRLRRARQQAEERLAAMPQPVDTNSLKDLVQRIRPEGDMEAKAAALAGEIANLQQAIDVDLANLALWQGTAEEIERLAVPSSETVERFVEEFRDRKARQEALAGQKSQETAETRGLESRIDELDREQTVPTEADLRAARQRRDEGCRLLLASIEEGGAVAAGIDAFVEQFAPGHSLGEAYQRSVAAADELADRLRREANRVATKAKLQSDLQQRTQKLQELESDLANPDAGQQSLAAEWRKQWAATGIAPLTPREMVPWRRRQQELSQRAAALRGKRVELDRIQQRVAAAKLDLSRLFHGIGVAPAAEHEALQALLARAQDCHETNQRILNQRNTLEEQLRDYASDLQQADEDHTTAERDLGEWKSNWAVEMDRLGLDDGATAAQANSVLSLITELFEKLRAADQLRDRLVGIDADARKFIADVRAATAQLAPDLADEAAEAAVAELNRRLAAGRAAQQQCTTLKQRHQEQDGKRRQAEEVKGQAEARLEAMCKEAGCAGYEDLPAAEERSRRRRELESSLRQIENQMLAQGDGATVEEFAAEIEREGADVATLQQAIDQLEQESQRLGQTRDEVLRRVEGEKHALAAMDGNDRAAEKAGQCERLAAQVEEDLHQLAVLRVAAAVLRESIERYRKRNQGPVLDCASRLFAEITLGSFEGLRAEFDDQGVPVLVGVRPGGSETVGVKGMSDGTCDQLYLAMRVASLEHWLDQHEPMPFVADDVLLNFDDARAAAALQVLSRLSRRTQVVFFTHHRRLVDLVTEHLGQDNVMLHQLDRTSAAPM